MSDTFHITLHLGSADVHIYPNLPDAHTGERGRIVLHYLDGFGQVAHVEHFSAARLLRAIKHLQSENPPPA